MRNALSINPLQLNLPIRFPAFLINLAILCLNVLKTVPNLGTILSLFWKCQLFWDAILVIKFLEVTVREMQHGHWWDHNIYIASPVFPLPISRSHSQHNYQARICEFFRLCAQKSKNNLVCFRVTSKTFYMLTYVSRALEIAVSLLLHCSLLRTAKKNSSPFFFSEWMPTRNHHCQMMVPR